MKKVKQKCEPRYTGLYEACKHNIIHVHGKQQATALTTTPNIHITYKINKSVPQAGQL